TSSALSSKARMPAPARARRRRKPATSCTPARSVSSSVRCAGSPERTNNRNEKERAMKDMDFTGKTVLVVGGSSGIGNGIAHAFRTRGAEVHIWGTRASAKDYDGTEGSDMTGLRYAQMDISDFDAIEAYAPPFKSLDVLVLSQGTVIYKRGEFRMDGFQKVMDVNLNSLIACAIKFHDMLAAAKGSLFTVSSTAGFHSTRGNPAYNASKS